MRVTHLPGADFLQTWSRWQKWVDLSSVTVDARFDWDPSQTSEK